MTTLRERKKRCSSRKEQTLAWAEKVGDPGVSLLATSSAAAPSVPKARCYICRQPESAPGFGVMCRPCQKAYDAHVRSDDGTLNSAYLWVAARAWRFAEERRKQK